MRHFTHFCWALSVKSRMRKHSDLLDWLLVQMLGGAKGLRACWRGQTETQSLLKAQAFTKRQSCNTVAMFLYLLVHVAYHSSRWLPRTQRFKFQIVNAVFILVVLIPQIYIMARPKSSRYCSQPLLINLSASVVLSFVASGFSLLFTLIDPVPQSLWASFHVFGLLSCGHGLCTCVLTLTAAECVKSTPELYYMSVALTVASAVSAGFLLLRGGLWLSNMRPVAQTG